MVTNLKNGHSVSGIQMVRWKNIFEVLDVVDTWAEKLTPILTEF